MWKRLGGVLLAAVLLGVSSPPTTAAASGCWRLKSAERLFARKINHARARRDVARLHLDPQLSKVARKHSWEMKAKGSLHHTPLRVLGRRITRWRILGENVGWGASVASLHRRFMRSPAHRANILLRGFRHMGLGVQRQNGRLWVTVVFQAASDPGTSLRMPSC
jgi:uncharacterized protein YkwD